MKSGIEITGNRNLMKALQSHDKNAFLKYALKKTYNINVKDGHTPHSPESFFVKKIHEMRSGHHRQKKDEICAHFFCKPKKHPTKRTPLMSSIIRRLQNEKIEKDAYITRGSNGSGKVELKVQVPQIPSHYFYKRTHPAKRHGSTIINFLNFFARRK